MHVTQKKGGGWQNSKTERNWSVKIQNDAEDVPTSLKRELDVDGRSQREGKKKLEQQIIARTKDVNSMNRACSQREQKR